MPRYIDFDKINFVEKKFVHKEKKSNVHIYNLRRLIPRLIPVDIFLNDLLPKLSNEEKEFLLTYFVKRKLQNDEPYYILRSLPNKISADDMNIFFEQNLIPDEEKDFLMYFYKFDEKENSFILVNSFSELDELHIAKILTVHVLLTPDVDKERISKLLEICNKIEKDDIFYANMHVDPEHEYFFEHKLDHIPGMMLIETARQFFMSCAHIYGNVPLDGVFFTLDSMKISFSEYLWMSYPTRMELRMKKVTYNEKGFWHKCSCAVIFYQESRQKARINITGMTIPMNSLEKITIKKQLNAALNFNVLPGIHSEVYLHDVKNDISYVGNIVDISPKHFMVEFLEDVKLSQTDEFDFRISLEKYYYTYGVCVLRQIQKSSNRIVANFLITHMDSPNSKNINEIIKRLCHIRERRGIL